MLINSDVVLEARPWPRSASTPNVMALALALGSVAVALGSVALALALGSVAVALGSVALALALALALGSVALALGSVALALGSVALALKGHSGAELHIYFLVHLESIYYQIFFYSKIVPNCAVAK